MILLKYFLSFSFLSSLFIVLSPSFLHEIHTPYLSLILFFAMSVCFLNSLPNHEYSTLLIAAAFYSKSFSGKTSALVKDLYLPTFIELDFCSDSFDFPPNNHFIISSSLMDYLMLKLHHSLQMNMVL